MIAAAVVSTFVGCVGTGAKNESAPVEEKGLAPLRVAVFVDKGARSIGAFRWLELATRAKGVVATPIDGEAVRRGALDATDVLVMPGGSSVAESKSLGPEGREKVKSFVRKGGGYVGTCAGCCLLMESASHHPDMLHLIPFKFGQGGHFGFIQPPCRGACGNQEGRYEDTLCRRPRSPAVDSREGCGRRGRRHLQRRHKHEGRGRASVDGGPGRRNCRHIREGAAFRFLRASRIRFRRPLHPEGGVPVPDGARDNLGLSAEEARAARRRLHVRRFVWPGYCASRAASRHGRRVRHRTAQQEAGRGGIPAPRRRRSPGAARCPPGFGCRSRRRRACPPGCVGEAAGRFRYRRRSR